MKNVLLQHAMKLNKNRKYRKGWQSLVRMMVMVVVFCTTYALILPAITIQAEPICGLEEHVHTEECFEQQTTTVFACELPEGAVIVHQHGTACRDVEGKLICTLEEISTHTHEDACYGQSDVLNCPVTHVHTEGCVKTELVTTCGQEEVDAHTHGAGCFAQESVQTCTVSEGHVHGEGCFEKKLVAACGQEESEEHSHEESCFEEQSVQTCAVPENHAHGEPCFELQNVKICVLEETEGHAHSESCCTEQQTTCGEISADEHQHEESCYHKSDAYTCGKDEFQLHAHGEECYDAEGNLLCRKPVVIEHDHSESCLVTQTQQEPVQICTLDVHSHTDECYPLEEEPTLGLSYHCGYANHAHNENCYAADETMTCTIPEHSHDAACVVENLDLTADVELASEWEAELAELEFTGVWADDLLTVAKSQLGYKESEKNCILKNEQLLGYTRYADWYGKYYGEWDDMFVAFCLNYAEITTEYIPTEADTAKWIEKLEEKELYTAAGDYTPVTGDLIFWDSDDDETVDKSGIVAKITVEDEKTEIRVIAGDTKNNCVETVTFERNDEEIVGYCKLPANPMSEADWAAAEEVAAMLEELPSAETVEATIQELNESGDKAGYEALRQELVTRIEAVRAAYDALSEDQKARAGSTDKLTALQELCGGETWQQFPALGEDGAVVTALTADGAEVIRAETPDAETEADKAEETSFEEETAAEETVIPDNMVQAQDVVRYTFTVTTESYYTDVRYGEARVKLEMVLPLTADKAAFDTEAMTWLEESVLTTETRTINDAEVTCQVLTGYKKLTSDETTGIVVPGSVTETAAVKVLKMAHGEQVTLIISAAMEHGTWEGTCETHQVPEKLTIATSSFIAYAPATAEEQQANYEAFQLKIEELVAAGMVEEDLRALMLELAEAYRTGALSAVQYEELAALIDSLRDIDYANLAEPCLGNAWLTMDFDPSYYYGEEAVMLYSFARTASVAAEPALAAETYATVFASAVQIEKEGGEAVSDDEKVMVSKTIEGTDTENVFDITLQIVTQDVVEEIYKDPNMAVVVVMDVSNTMKSTFESGDGTTRYQAAVAAASDFLRQFATQNSTLSQVGFVAFNTNAHKIFDLSPCNTTDQANALISEMATDTKSIMDAYVSGDRKRFTNMEAGLKMARDMLADAPNAHKYVIFLTDGFPTTYVSSGYTGYDPYYVSSYGSAFTDVVLKNKKTYYGTSYSDTAAIKARQMAVNMKNDGINIFSIGVDVSGQALSYYHSQSYNASGYSVVERSQTADYYNSTGYEIGLKHSDLWTSGVPDEDASDYDPAKYPEWVAKKAAEAVYFKKWLEGGSSTGIGSGYYYDSNNSDGLSSAFASIFETIVELNASSAHLDWVASDPMPDMGVHEVEAMEFIGFWDKSGNLVDKLEGESADGAQYENTANFDTDTSTIHWDIKNSGYISQSVNNTTSYLCELSYRVRLKNEESVFEEGEIYNTNDVTTLTYRVIEVSGGTTTISAQRTVNFPIPAVHGYVSELNFQKTDPLGYALSGAEFTLTHDTESCEACTTVTDSSGNITRYGTTCAGSGVGTVVIEPVTKTSDDNGNFTFTNIPSGHIYKLEETKVPDSYIDSGNTYKVSIAYNGLSVEVRDASGNLLEWKETIENDMYYTLPETGGMGTPYLTFGGLLMVAVSLVFICIIGRKRQKGGR